jgi:CRISPR-associated exonuclease Cas4
MTASSADPFHTTGIAISSVILASRCIRQYYFNKKDDWRSSYRYTICKQVSCAYPEEREEVIWKIISLINPDISPDSRIFLTSCLSAMKSAPIRPWTDSDITVKSEKIGVYGLLDKYDTNSGDCTLTRCCDAPKSGCWPEDTIRIAALLICIEETCNIRPHGMHIEYIPSGIIRYYEPTPKDRRRLVQIIHQVKEVERGTFPPKPLHPPCSRCRFVEKCSVDQPRKLSILFKK